MKKLLVFVAMVFNLAIGFAQGGKPAKFETVQAPNGPEGLNIFLNELRTGTLGTKVRGGETVLLQKIAENVQSQTGIETSAGEVKGIFLSNSVYAKQVPASQIVNSFWKDGIYQDFQMQSLNQMVWVAAFKGGNSGNEIVLMKLQGTYGACWNPAKWIAAPMAPAPAPVATKTIYIRDTVYVATAPAVVDVAANTIVDVAGAPAPMQRRQAGFVSAGSTYMPSGMPVYTVQQPQQVVIPVRANTGSPTQGNPVLHGGSPNQGNPGLPNGGNPNQGNPGGSGTQTPPITANPGGSGTQTPPIYVPPVPNGPANPNQGNPGW